MKVITEEEFNPFAKLVLELQEQLKELKQKQEHRMKEPGEWVIRSEANKLFIGKGGKMLERHAFCRMVENWLEQGDLVRGVNYLESGSVKFISKEFLRGTVKPSKKLKRA